MITTESLPTYDEAFEAHPRNALEHFIVEYELAGHEDSEKFRNDLARLLSVYDHALQIIYGLCRRHTRSQNTSPFNPVRTIEKIEAIALGRMAEMSQNISEDGNL